MVERAIIVVIIIMIIILIFIYAIPLFQDIWDHMIYIIYMGEVCKPPSPRWAHHI